MPRKIKVVEIQNEIVASPDPMTDIPNDIQDVSDPISQPDPPDEPVVIPEETVKEIVKQNEIDNKETKEPKTGTCNLCNKTMLLKNLKYSHPKVCKNRPPPEAPPPPPPSVEEVEKIVHKAIQKAVVAEKPPIEILKQQKAEVRKQRIKSLIDQAF